MVHLKISKVLKEAEDFWAKDERNKDGSNNAYKKAFILGWLESAYDSMYNDLPKKFKEQLEEISHV